jgi:hypothetical protein
LDKQRGLLKNPLKFHWLALSNRLKDNIASGDSL